MFRFGSLKTRIIVLTTLPLFALVVALLVGTIRTANQAVRSSVQESLSDAGSVFIQLLSTHTDELLTMARVTARDPRFFATFSIPEDERGDEFVPTLAGVSRDFLRITDADFLEVFDANGRPLLHVDAHTGPRTDVEVRGNGGLAEAMNGFATGDFYTTGEGPVASASAPVWVAQSMEAVLRLGWYLDSEFLADVKRLTGADVTLLVDGSELSSTFAQSTDAGWTYDENAIFAVPHGSVSKTETFTAMRAGVEYMSILVRVNGVDSRENFDAVIARELSMELAPLVALETRIGIAGFIAILVTLLAGFLLARSITGPLSRVVSAASALMEGRYDHPLEVPGRDEVAYLARVFNEMRQSLHTYLIRLKNIDQMKSNFIALAGHELRTPLTIISGFNELIVTGALGEVPDKIKETTQHIQEQLSDLNAQVQKILDLSTIEQGLLELNREDSAIQKIVTAAVESRRDVIASRGLNLVVNIPQEEKATYRLDSYRIEQCVLNILDNAIRFTPDGGQITVSVREEDAKAYIAVRDTGVGIPPSEVDWIFRKTYDTDEVLHHKSGQYRFGSRGLGLGLALTRALVEKHGGEILVKSTPGRGSEFTIVLNAEAPEKAAREPVPAH
jgi:signal transduction histidine kinase